MSRSTRLTIVATAVAASALSWAIASAGDPPAAPGDSPPKDASTPRFARVDLRSLLEFAPFREAQLERQREILDRHRPTIDSCREEMKAIVEEWEKLPEHDEIPPQLEDRTEEVLKRWEGARRALVREGDGFAEAEGKPFRERLRTLLEDAARRGGFDAVFQLPREQGGATWATSGAADPEFARTQSVVWCRECPDLTDELAEVLGIPADAWIEDSGFRRAAIDFQREFDSYAEPPPFDWDLGPAEGEEEPAR